MATGGSGRPTAAATLAATAVAAVLSGAPSTTHSILTRRPLLGAVQAAATLVPGRARPRPGAPVAVGDLVAGAAAHTAVSLLWGTVLARTLPAGRRAAWGAAAGVAIHVLDLGVVARLPAWPRCGPCPRSPSWATTSPSGSPWAWSSTSPRRDDGPVPGGRARRQHLGQRVERRTVRSRSP